jgi:hypothetical protein
MPDEVPSQKKERGKKVTSVPLMFELTCVAFAEHGEYGLFHLEDCCFICGLHK